MRSRGEKLIFHPQIRNIVQKTIMIFFVLFVFGQRRLLLYEGS